MTTLRSALIEARAEFSELPAGEIRRKIDNILKDESITDIDGWVIDECQPASWSTEDDFYGDLPKTPF